MAFQSNMQPEVNKILNFLSVVTIFNQKKLDLPSNLKLKYRETGQAAPEEVRKDKKELRKELEEREKIATNKDTNKQRLGITEKEAVVTKKPK